MQIEKIDFYGMSAIHFEAGGYEAIMIPEIGANVVKLSHKASGTNILRTPAEDEIETFKGRPQVFGLPLLFPPNRIEDIREPYIQISDYHSRSEQLPSWDH